MFQKTSKSYTDRDDIYKRHILDAVYAIEEYTKEKTLNDFANDRLLQDGVVRKLEVIGEASKRLSDEFKSLVNLPWRKITGTRDKLIHDYFKVDMEAVWKTITEDLKELKNVLENLK